jgi:hypothetical protein
MYFCSSFQVLPSISRVRKRFALGLATLLFAVPATFAKEIPITGILLYRDQGTPAYVEVTGLKVNEKNFLRACNDAPKIDKSAYKNLPKINFTDVKQLDRLPNGKLVATIGTAAPICVVPGNFKWEKEGELSPSELVDKSSWVAQITGASIPGRNSFPLMPLDSRFIFGSDTDKELAAYSLADWAKSIDLWKTYFSEYPNGAHLAAAKATDAGLLVADGQAKLDLYRASTKSATPDWDALKGARERAAEAAELLPAADPPIALRDAVRAELKTVADVATVDDQAYRDALAAHSAGYAKLMTAKDLSDHITVVDPKFTPGTALASNVAIDVNAYEVAIKNANAQITAHQFDNAYADVKQYVAFTPEEPRLKEIVTAVYKYHLGKGKSEEVDPKWSESVADLKTANDVSASPESKAELAKAEAGLLAYNNKQAADKALAISKQRLDDKDIIGAYEVLADLNEAQRKLVKSEMEAQQPDYVVAATARAHDLEAGHSPIRGRVDEEAIRQAYDYLRRASELSDNPDIAFKRDLMADNISAYYVGVAGKYLSKPLASGVGLGVAYLNEALLYKPNLDIAHDAITTNSLAYTMRSRLSISVVFRDQTSRRESAGFADQLQQAFATGIETSGIPAKVIILPAPADSMPATFQFVGEILEHRTIPESKIETLQSHYRSGQHEVPNDAWNKADQDFEAQKLQLEKAQGALSAAQVKNNKKAIEDAQKDIDTIQANVQKARSTMNSTPEKISVDTISPYNYTRETLDIKNVVDLSFRILDAAGTIIGDPIHVVKGDQPKHFVILDGVKPEDTDGVKLIDSRPNTEQLMTDVENEARDAMVKAARQKVQELPGKVLELARNRASAGDAEAAGELFILYLNSTPETASSLADRQEARHFLSDNFNLRNTAILQASAH